MVQACRDDVETLEPGVAGPLRALTADLPRDQALGLRLIALARAAAAVHAAEAARPSPEAAPRIGLARTQAAGLAGGGE